LPQNRIERVYQILPPEARDWAIRHGIPQPPLAALSGGQKANQKPLRLLMPDPFTVYQLTPQIPFSSQRIRFAAAVPPGTTQITFWLDGKALETLTDDPYWMWWALVPGQHTLKVTAELTDGTSLTSDPIQFQVVSFAPPDQKPS